MIYICRKCGNPFRWTDPIEPNKKLSAGSTICPKCRQKKYEKDKEYARDYSKEWRKANRTGEN